MGWIVYFIVYVLLGIGVDNEADALPDRLATALILLVWPLIVVAYIVSTIRSR